MSLSFAHKQEQVKFFTILILNHPILCAIFSWIICVNHVQLSTLREILFSGGLKLPAISRHRAAHHSLPLPFSSAGFSSGFGVVCSSSSGLLLSSGFLLLSADDGVQVHNTTMDANAVKMDFSFVKNNVIAVENSARQIYVTQLRSRRRLRRRLCSLLRPSRHHWHCPWLYPGLPLRSSEYHFLRHRTKWFPLC